MTDEFCVELDGWFGYKRARIFLLQGLGVGSYGSVYIGALDELPCAAKMLHSTFFGTRDPGAGNGAGNVASRFEKECRFISDLKHPRLVQLLGLAHEPRSACPILLMELMDENLTQFLKRQSYPLPLHVQVNLIHDITLALAYLHSNEIVHRNLSSNNVLVIGIRAKVTDFGMSKMIDTNPCMIPVTKCTENHPFMPPEIFLTDPLYSDKVDVFSTGVLIIQIITREFPAPTKSKCIENFPASPIGVIEVPVLERKRRNNDISRISPTHPLLPVALDCLKDKHGDRPSAGQLCQRLPALKEAPLYVESMQGRVEGAPGQGNISTCTSLEKKGKDSDEFPDNLQEKEAQLQETLQHLAERDRIIQGNEEMIKAKDEEVQTKSQEVAQLQRELEEQSEEFAKLARLPEEKQSNKVPTEQFNSPLKLPLLPEEKLHLKWQVMHNAPIKIVAGGNATVDGNTVYFLGYNSFEIHGYLLNEDQWKIRLTFPRCSAALAIIRGLLTGIGGGTNEVTSWNENGWEEVFPPMSVLRSNPAVVSSGNYIIVVGGQGPNDELLTSIEVFNNDSSTWAIIADTPHPFRNINATLCGDRLYIAAQYDNVNVYSIRLRFNEPKDETNLSLELSTQSKWRQHAIKPTYYSSLCTISNQVVSVGGMINNDYKSGTGDVYGLDNGHWVKIGCLESARAHLILAVVSGNRMLALGGSTQTGYSDVLELAVLC